MGGDFRGRSYQVVIANMTKYIYVKNRPRFTSMGIFLRFLFLVQFRALNFDFFIIASESTAIGATSNENYI